MKIQIKRNRMSGKKISDNWALNADYYVMQFAIAKINMLLFGCINLRQIYIFHTLIDTMKNLLNYQQLSPFDGVRVSCGERLRRCIIIVIGENLLFDLTRVFSRSLAPASWWSAALILCNCNYHFHKQCMVVVIAAVLNARAFNVSQIR